MKYCLSVLISFLFFSGFYAQTRKPKPAVKDSISSEAFMRVIDETLNAYYAEFANQSNFDSIINVLEYEPNTIPQVSDEVYCQRLEKMNEMTPFHLDCNPISLSTIRFFASNRRSFAKVVLGRSALYFDMYEAALAKYDLPIELKYLSVIESGLRPQVKSPAGALGLWQFMYGTGKMYGLTENSYIDERMDPARETDAACRYLKKLFGIYGDWNLALAAYNAGPGNINKAIRRSGGKRTYWEVRPFLPRETQGYVPNFIAAAYLLTYHAEHNIEPAPAKINYYQLDTMCLTKGIHMSTIASLIDWTVEEIKTLNPIYKAQYIPVTQPNQCITGPLTKIGKLVSLEDSLYKLENSLYGSSGKLTPLPIDNIIDSNEVAIIETPINPNNKEFIFHKVKSGETLSSIARKYNVTNSQITKLNRLRSTRVTRGQTLKIPQKSTTVAPPVITPPVKKDSLAMTMGTVYYDSSVTVIHIVQRNESLTVIAGKYNTTAEKIRELNGLKDNWLNIGQKLKVNTVIKLSKAGLVKTEVIKSEPVIPKTVVPKPEVKKYYKVKSGDLFGRIADKHGLTPAQLQKLNPGIKPDRINVGQEIRIK
jgi:membrane-bound lytic murein transglycosylase D